MPLSDDFELRPVRLTDADALRLVDEVQQEYVVRYGGPDRTPLEPAYFDPPSGAFFVGYLDEQPVAMGGWRRRQDVEAFGRSESAEIKRMYVVEAARRRGLARRVLTHLEDTARAAGADLMVLETGLMQPEAIALYESAGYVGIPGFGYYKDFANNRCYAKPL